MEFCFVNFVATLSVQSVQFLEVVQSYSIVDPRVGGNVPPTRILNGIALSASSLPNPE